MTRQLGVALVAMFTAGAATASAQDVIWTPAERLADHMTVLPAGAQRLQIVSAAPLERVPPVKNAPFSAEAINEFTQILADGNRIERRYSTSLWRDSQGRTRREQEVALLGRLNVSGDPPKMVTIDDPVGRVTYTLDNEKKIARTTSVTTARIVPDSPGGERGRVVVRSPVPAGLTAAGTNADFILSGPPAVLATGPALTLSTGPAGETKVEPLGTRTIEGVEAEGTRTTTTIPAGAIGNINAIDVVTERWFSKALQTVVMLTRRDPQTGDTVYRLTNIVRAEPDADLFVVPAGYTTERPRF